MQLIMRLHPPAYATLSNDLELFLWHLRLNRAFGFGRTIAIERFHEAKNMDEAIKIFDKLKEIHHENMLNIPAYGDLRTLITCRTRTLEGLKRLSERLSCAYKESETLTFHDAYQMVIAQKIPTMNDENLIPWRFTCDLAEYGVCEAPSAMDLARKIGDIPINLQKRMRGGSGPRKALIQSSEEGQIPIPFTTSIDLAVALDHVLEVWQQEDCIIFSHLQHRLLNMSDMEHMLCKVHREELKTRGKY